MKLKMLGNLTPNDCIIAKNIFGAFLIKGGALCVSILSTPAFISYFNNQTVLGVWYTLLSVLIWFLNFDLGVGNGIRNNLVEAFTKKDFVKAKRVISSGIVSCGFIAILLCIIGGIIVSCVPWNTILNVSQNVVSSKTLETSVLIVFIAIMFRFLLTTVNSIFYALQMSAVNNALSLCVSTSQLIFVLTAKSSDPQVALINISYAYLFTSNLPVLFAAIILFATKLKQCRPSIRYVNAGEMKNVLSIGGMFFVCQIFYMLIVNTNEFFITYYFGPSYTTEYAFYFKITSIFSMVITLAMTPIWSAITKAMSEDSWDWINSLYKKLKWLAATAVAICFCIVPFLQFIMDIWLGQGVLDVKISIALAFAFFGGAFIYSSILSTIVCGMARMKLQAVCYGVGVLFKILFIIFFARKTGIWNTIVWSNTVVLIPYCVLQQIDLNLLLKKKIDTI